MYNIIVNEQQQNDHRRDSNHLHVTTPALMIIGRRLHNNLVHCTENRT